jgi:signal transduction histidine kinase
MTEIELRTSIRQLEDARAEAEGAAVTLRELQAISDAALVNLDVDDLLPELLARVTAAVDPDVAAILLDGEIRASHGAEPGDVELLTALGQTLVSERGAGTGPVSLGAGELSAAPGGIRALLGVTLDVGGSPVGLLAVGARSAREFSGDERKLLELAAERAGHGIYNARLFERSQSNAELLEQRLVATLKRQQSESERAASERGRLLTHVVAAQEEERRRIARDVHDDYLQALSAVRMDLERLEGALDEPRLRESAARLGRDVAATTERMRGLVFDLRPPALDWAGLGSALRLYLEEAKDRFGLDYVLDIRLDDEPEPEVRLVGYRIAQEAITNVVKHAQASVVHVSVAAHGGGVLVTVRDDGRGVESQPGARSFGLAGMRERAESAGGRWRIDSQAGAGTTVEFWLPASIAG